MPRSTIALLLAAWPAAAAVPAQQAAALHGALTPVGAERAGNAQGTIPAWTGGLAAPLPPGGRPTIAPAPFAGEAKLFTIDAANVATYADRLPQGALALFRRFPDYRMHIYPTHRTAALPQAVYDAIARNATRAHAAPDGIAYGVADAAGGAPFPIPANGAEIVWNHILAFWGAAREDHIDTYVAAGDGSIVQTAGYSEVSDFPYYAPNATPDSIGRYYFKTRRLQDAPPASVGEGYVAWQPLDVGADRFVAWRYLPGEHRARKAPSLSYDTPDPGSSGYEALDEYYLFFGGQDRYVFRILGKKEMFVPYNNNAIAHHPARDAMAPLHANQDALRYELHRVWIVEGTLAPGAHHVAPRRRLYIDEDTWMAEYAESWDEDGRLWKFGQATMMVLPQLPAVIGGSSFFYDLLQGGYCFDFVVSPAADYVITPMHRADVFGPEALAANSLR